MPSKTHLLKFGPFIGGLNTRKKPWLLDPTEGQNVVDADTRIGSLSGTLDISASVFVNSNFLYAKWIWPLGGGSWGGAGSTAVGFANERRWAMNDGSKTYFTRVGNQAQTASAAGETSDLGIRPPDSASWTLTVDGTLSGTFKYGISYKTFDSFGGVSAESNIQPFDLTFTFPIVVGANSYDEIHFGYHATSNPTGDIWPTDPRVSEVQLWRTTAGGSIFYRVPNSGATIGSVTTRTSKALVDNGNVADSTLDDGTIANGGQLTWAVGGTPQSTGQYTADHSPAPVLTRLADRIHSQASGTAVAGSGIVFGAVGNILRWSVVGYPQYWPSTNSFPFDHQIEALIAYSGYMVVFTTGGIYRVAGNNDDAMEAERLSAFYSIRPGAGKSCLRTPHGTIYLTVEGLAVFDGSQARPVLTNKQLNTDFDGKTIYDSAYFNDKYYLFHDSGYIRVDLKDGWEGVRWNTSATVFNCVVTTDFKNPLVGDARRSIPITASSSTTIGMRRFGFCAGGGATYGNYIFLAGGTKVDFTQGFGEVALSTAYKMDVSISSGVWVALSTFVDDGSGNTIRCDASLVYVNARLYLFGGRPLRDTSNVVITTCYSSAQKCELSTGVWTADTTAGGPGAIRSHAAAADTTGGDATGFWVQGGIDSSSVVKSALYKYTIAGPSWASIGSGGPSLLDHRMVYVPGSVFTDTHPRLFIFGGTTSDADGNVKNIIYCFDLTDATWKEDSASDNGDTSAQAAGVAKRRRHVWVYDQVAKRIFLHGGKGSDGGRLSDIWEFDPKVWVDKRTATPALPAVTAWKNTSGAVVNVLERQWHGGAIVPGTASPVTGQTLYVAAGSSAANSFNSDVYAVYIQALTGPNNPDYSTTAGVYGLKPNSGGNIYRLEGGAAQQATWQTGDSLGGNPASIKHATEGVFDFVGDVRVGVHIDGGAAQTMFTLSSATQTQLKKKLPWTGSTAARGKRLSFSFICLTATAATSGVAGELLSAHIRVVEQFGD